MPWMMQGIKNHNSIKGWQCWCLYYNFKWKQAYQTMIGFFFLKLVYLLKPWFGF